MIKTYLKVAYRNLVRHRLFSFINIFGLEEGDERTALTEPSTIVLTRKNAIKYFGTDNVIGQSLRVEQGGELLDYTVTGILKEVPKNSHIHFDMLMSIASFSTDFFANMRSNYLYTYVLISENATKQALKQSLKTFVEKRLEPAYDDLTAHGLGIHEVLEVQLFPITNIHLNTIFRLKQFVGIAMTK